MRERQFAGYLNSKSVYGRSYSDSEGLRFCKYIKIQNLIHSSATWRRWYSVSHYMYPSWSKSLWNRGRKDVEWTQRQNNFGRKKKRIELFPWRVGNESLPSSVG